MVILEDHGGDMYFENYFKPFVFLYNYLYNFKRLNFTLYILLNFEKNSYLNYLHLLTFFTLNINKNYLIHLILRDLIYTYNNITKPSQVINILFCLLRLCLVHAIVWYYTTIHISLLQRTYLAKFETSLWGAL